MEIRNLRYFLAVAREENMSKAAASLHISQPALSKAIRSLEEELGKKLFLRHSFSIELTDEGVLLRDRAEDLVLMADKIEKEFLFLDDVTSGDIYFGLAESYQVRHLADKGLLDFALICETPDSRKYDYILLPEADSFGVVMKSDCPLAKKKKIQAKDLKGLPLFCSEQSWKNDIAPWAKEAFADYVLEGSFRLSYNGSMFTREGLGYLLTFDHLIDTSEKSGLVFRPLDPPLVIKQYIIFNKYQSFTPIAQRFLEQIRESFAQNEKLKKDRPRSSAANGLFKCV